MRMCPDCQEPIQHPLQGAMRVVVGRDGKGVKQVLQCAHRAPQKTNLTYPHLVNTNEGHSTQSQG